MTCSAAARNAPMPCRSFEAKIAVGGSGLSSSAALEVASMLAFLAAAHAAIKEKQKGAAKKSKKK